MKEWIKAPKIELSDGEMDNLSYSQFKTLEIRMLTELSEYGHKIEEKVKAMQSERKKNIQGTNTEGKETRTQINDLEQKEEINIQQEQNEETRIQKNERGLGTSGTTLNVPTSKSQGARRRRESKKLKTYLKT